MSQAPLNKFLQLKIASNFGENYYYAERLGKDSVAFVLYSDDGKYGLIREWKPPLQQFMVSAFGGSLDDSSKLIDTVIKEVEEESGYSRDVEDVVYKGSFMASTQSNEVVHLFLVNIGLIINTGEVESNTEIVWTCKEESKLIPCWKARLIIDN